MREMKSTRCHAVVMNGRVMRNVIVSYPASTESSSSAHRQFSSITHRQSGGAAVVVVNPRCSEAKQGGAVPTSIEPWRGDIVVTKNQQSPNHSELNYQLHDITVKPFTGEVHSTDDFNGIIALTPIDYELPSDFSIQAETFTHDTNHLDQLLPTLQPDTPIKLLFLPLE